MPAATSDSEVPCRAQSCGAPPPVFVHIGLPKTATTSIQSFLANNRDALLRQGVLYPESGANRDSYALVHRPLRLVLEPETVPGMAALGNFRREDILERLRAEIACTRPSRVLISCEEFTGMHAPGLLRQALEPHPVRILITLRRQDSLLDSGYNQIVKSRLFSQTFDQFLQNDPSDPDVPESYCPDLAFCDYNALLQSWAAAFGEENILPCIYEDFSSTIGILQHLAGQVGFDIAPLHGKEDRHNSRLSPALLALKRRVNTAISGEGARMVGDRVFGRALQTSTRMAKPSPEARARNLARRNEILARYRESNAQVAKRYFAGRTPLFPEPSETDAMLPDADDHPANGVDVGLATSLVAALIQQVAAAEFPSSTEFEQLPQLPKTDSGPDRWDLIEGLFVEGMLLPHGAPKQPSLRLCAQDGDRRHAIAMHFTSRLPGGLHRATVALQVSRPTSILVSVRDGANAATGEPQYECAAKIDLAARSIVETAGAPTQWGFEESADGWFNIWADLDTHDGQIFLLVGLLERPGHSHVFKANREEFTLGPCQVVPQPDIANCNPRA